LSFCAVLVVRCGPIFARTLGLIGGAPELFLLLSLLLSVDSMGCPPWLVGSDVPAEPVCGIVGRAVGLLELTVGLKVTVRCGRGGGLLDTELLDVVGRRGVVSVELLDAMSGNGGSGVRDGEWKSPFILGSWSLSD
jgi:hypothetical protein